MATLSVLRHVTEDATNREAGSESTPVTLTITGNCYETRTIVADNYGTATLWATGDGGITSFDYLYLETDADIFVELRNDNSTDEFTLLFVPASHSLLLPTGLMGGFQTTTRIDGADLVAATDYGTIDQIKVQRDVADAVGDANVRLVLFD